MPVYFSIAILYLETVFHIYKFSVSEMVLHENYYQYLDGHISFKIFQKHLSKATKKVIDVLEKIG